MRTFIIYIIIFTLLGNRVGAAEILVDSGQRQTVLERTKQYAGKVDAVDIRANATLNFQKNLKVHSGGSSSGFGDKCGGYTTSVCGTPCCGEKECSSVCTANTSIAHGSQCLSEYTTSSCGMSCCGKEDCDRVCYNYRTTTATVDNCGGYIKTATGESCCGLEDCRNRSCGGYTSVVTADYGNEEKCCGEKNCLDVKCDYTHSTDVISGGSAKCCGTKDCYSKYCEGQTSVDSQVYPNKKNLECCGAENCRQVACDGYTQTNTPSGIRACCGYEDCRDKECQYRRTATLPNGEQVACCGIEECGNLEAGQKTIQPPGEQCSNLFALAMCSWDGSDQVFFPCSVSQYKTTPIPLISEYRVCVASGNSSSISSGVSTNPPKECSIVKTEEYDGITYYHFECIKQKNIDLNYCQKYSDKDYFYYWNPWARNGCKGDIPSTWKLVDTKLEKETYKNGITTGEYSVVKYYYQIPD